MSNTWKCDGPGCKTGSSWAFKHGIMRVSPKREDELHFCSWECIYRYSSKKREASDD